MLMTLPKLTATELSRLRGLCRSGEARDIRKRADISLAEMAEESGGVAAATIQRWETGQRMPRGETAALYAALLHRLRRVNDSSRAS